VDLGRLAEESDLLLVDGPQPDDPVGVRVEHEVDPHEPHRPSCSAGLEGDERGERPQQRAVAGPDVMAATLDLEALGDVAVEVREVGGEDVDRHLVERRAADAPDEQARRDMSLRAHGDRSAPDRTA
jgi:hypothetical protein